MATGRGRSRSGARPRGLPALPPAVACLPRAPAHEPSPLTFTLTFTPPFVSVSPRPFPLFSLSFPMSPTPTQGLR
nr:MAG TPA: hypothetical protein [Caudoviricetes sp.]